MLRGFGVFCSSYRFSGILVILDILRGYFGHFRGLELFLVILEGSGYLWSFRGFECILVILKL